MNPGTRPERFPVATHWGNYTAVVSGGKLLDLEPDARERDASPIGPGIARGAIAASRVTKPAFREGWLEHGPRRAENRRGRERFVELPWDEALAMAAHELARVSREHGNAAIYGGSYGWASAGRFHHAQSQLHRFLALCGGYTRSVQSYSAAAMEVVLPHVIGGDAWSILDRSPLWSEVEASGELVLAFGGIPLKNAQVNSGGVGSHIAREWQRRCRAAGVRFVNVSPLSDDAAEFLDAEWIPVRPNTDVALMLAMAHTLNAEELHDREFLSNCCTGFDRFCAYLTGASDGLPKTPEWAEPITEVTADRIRELARRVAHHRTLILASWSLQRAEHGEQTHWTAVALAAMSGSMGQRGGGFGTAFSAEDGLGSARQRLPVAHLPRPENPIRAYIPVARVADMLLHPGEPFDYNGQSLVYPDTRLVYWCGGNPFHHHQDLNRLARAWQEPETVIVHEPWWNPLARFADIVFPAATFLERNDFAAGAYDPWLSASHKTAEPPGETRTDYEIFSGLARELGFESAFTEGRGADEWVRHLYDETRRTLAGRGVSLAPFEEFWDSGRVRIPTVSGPPPGDFAALRRDPARNPLSTPSGKIELFSETVAGFGYEDCPGHPAWIEPEDWLGGSRAAQYPLHLVSNQPRTRLHSQFDHGGYSQASKISGREPVLINPGDAARRRIEPGDLVVLRNDRGACLAGAVISPTIRPGVVALATGAWFDSPDPGNPAAIERHGNPNVLTPDRGSSRLAQGPSAHSALVEITRFRGKPPRVAAFDPPEFGRYDARLSARVHERQQKEVPG